MGTMRFLLLWGCLTLLLSLMVSAHSQPGPREGDHSKSKRQNSKNDHHTNGRNEKKEMTRRSGVFSALGGESDHTKLSKPRPGFISAVSVKDTPNIMDLSRHSLENGRRRRQSNGKYGKPKKPCPGCYSHMSRPQKQKRKGRKKGVTINPPEMCPGCSHPLGRPLKLKDLEEREPSRKRGHKRPKKVPPRGLGRSMKQEESATQREDAEGKRRERGRGEHHHGSQSGLATEEEPRRHHGQHKKEKHGKHRKNHQHEHSAGKDEKEE